MEIITQLNSDGWSYEVAKFPLALRDTYFTPEYCGLHAANNEGECYAAVFSEGSDRLFITGLLNPTPGLIGSVLPGKYFDIQTCNGYGGPLASTSGNPGFIERAWQQWRRSCMDIGIVAAFFRLHPLIENDRWLPRHARIIPDRKTVYIDLSAGVDAMWQRADSRHRNMVNKGKQTQMEVLWNDASGWDDFEALYAEAMDRLDAPASLRFSNAYFRGLRALPGVQLACVRSNGTLLAASSFMFGPWWAHYHLSARGENAGNHITNCILQAACERAAGCGLQGLHLGGGRTQRSDDSLLKFKLSLGGQTLDFKVALVVADKKAYEHLCFIWTQQARTTSSRLLPYRSPTPLPANVNSSEFSRPP